MSPFLGERGKEIKKKEEKGKEADEKNRGKRELRERGREEAEEEKGKRRRRILKSSFAPRWPWKEEGRTSESYLDQQIE